MRRAYSARSWMLGATTAVSRRTGGLLSSGGDELGDGFVEQLRLLPLDPVSALRHGADRHAGEEVGELIAPGGGEDRVVLRPGDAGGKSARRSTRCGWARANRCVQTEPKSWETTFIFSKPRCSTSARRSSAMTSSV